VPNGTLWVQRSAEFVGIALQTYRAAGARLETAAAGRAPGTWAVVLDADETVLNNVQFQVEIAERGQVYSAALWNAWVRRREAAPMPGAPAFLARARQLGGLIAIVTNRLVSECADTIAVFERHALVYDAMLCRPDDAPSDKNPRFASVASGAAFARTMPVEIVAFVGDNIHDFPLLSQTTRTQGESAFRDFGVRYFLLPGPMYGSWER
jgi:5'-nucleotidase (lipoprotein e(P4) family)